MSRSTKTHIGLVISRVLEQKQTNISQFAKDIFCTRDNVYKIISKKSIDTSLLFRISVALGYDFFAEYSRDLKIEETPESTTRETP